MNLKKNSENELSTKYNETFSNMDIEETLNNLKDYSIYIANIIEILVSYEDQTNNYLTADTFKRYKGQTLLFTFQIKNFNEYFSSNAQFIDSKTETDALDQAFLSQCWTNLGSLLESSLQMFLSFYSTDFINSNWGIWDKQTIEQLKDATKKLNNQLKAVVKNNNHDENEGLNGKKRKRFMENINSFMKEKEKLPNIEDISLSYLIDFYESEKVIPEAFNKNDMHRIREFRNAIHSFKSREIGTWEDLNKYSKEVLKLLIKMIDQLLPLPDYAKLDEDFVKEMNRLSKQQYQWVTK